MQKAGDLHTQPSGQGLAHARLGLNQEVGIGR